jgi:hypothetical protein
MLNVGIYEAVLLVAFLVIVVALVITGFRAGVDRVDAWAGSFGVDVPEASRPIVAAFLTRTRRFRLIAALVAVFGQGAIRAWVGDPLPWANTIVFAIAGYLVGAVLAEVVARSARDPGRGAVLSPRRVTDYVPRYGPVAMVALPLATAGAVLWLVVRDPGPRFGIAEPRTLALLVLASAVMGVVALIGLRLTVRRPQSASSPDLAELDDAIRSSSMHAICGGAVAFQLLLFAFSLGEIQGALNATGGSTRLQLAAAVTALFALVFALGAWVVLGHPSGWRTRRAIGSPTS